MGTAKKGQMNLNKLEPNVYHDLVAPEKTAFHHVGIWSDNYHADKKFLSSSYENCDGHGKRYFVTLIQQRYRAI